MYPARPTANDQMVSGGSIRLEVVVGEFLDHLLGGHVDAHEGAVQEGVLAGVVEAGAGRLTVPPAAVVAYVSCVSSLMFFLPEGLSLIEPLIQRQALT